LPGALIVSPVIYHEIVKHGYRRIQPETYHQVSFNLKELRTNAWVHVPGDPTAPQRLDNSSVRHLVAPVRDIPVLPEVGSRTASGQQ